MDVIYDTLRQTGLTWDEGPDVGGPVGPYVQSERMGMFKQYAEQLVKEGKAYYCFCTTERLEQLHEQQKAAGEAVGHYDRHCRDLSPEEVAEKLAAGTPYVIRQKCPTEGVTGFDDAVYGHIEVNNAELEDQILIKADGMPTYNFANVVDDHLMGITHVIRGSGVPVQHPQVQPALRRPSAGPKPVYIHCPPVMKDAQNKLTKRNGDASLPGPGGQGLPQRRRPELHPAAGLEPQGRAGDLHPGGDGARSFDESGISKSPAIFDPLKLRAHQRRAYIRRLTPEEFRKMADPWIDKAVHAPHRPGPALRQTSSPAARCWARFPSSWTSSTRRCPFGPELYANKKQKTTPDTATPAAERPCSRCWRGLAGLEQGRHLRGLQGPGRSRWRSRTAGCSTRWASPSPASSAPPAAALTWPP